MYKQSIIFVSAFITVLLAFAFRLHNAGSINTPKNISRQEAYKNKFTLLCSPDWNHLNSDSLAKDITILPGWGNYQWKISSPSDSASLYFQQGISMYYSFHIIEAMASFKKASQFDNKNAMIYWAQALAYGPNINDYGYASTPDAFAAAQKALELSACCTKKEQALIQAMAIRYSPDTSISRSSLNEKYTNAMRKAAELLPADADAAALYADAMMLQHPWEYWKHDGNAQPWTPLILQVLEKGIKFSPDHPGLNHYYIHTVEASPNPQRALQSANRLAVLLPEVSHMVHMPSHIYLRSGLYQQGIKVNEMSLKGYKDYSALYPAVQANAGLYLIHNVHMQADCAMMGAGVDYSTKAADDCRASFDSSLMSAPAPFGYFVQYVYMTPAFNNVRFGKWQAILDAPPVAATYVYAYVLDHWARGIAYARQNNLAAAKEELKIVKDNLQEAGMVTVMQPFNAPADAAKVAEKLLEGIIAEQAGDFKTAIPALKEAVKREDDMIYNEPKDWLIPVRPFLGHALLKAGLFSAAEKVFKADLSNNPANHWALKGLLEALQRQQKRAEANTIKKQLDKTIVTNDMRNLPAVY